MSIILASDNESASRALVGEAAWIELSIEWIDAKLLAETLGTDRWDSGSRPVVWLYRSPTSLAFDAGMDGVRLTESALSTWFEVNKAALEYSRRRGEGFCFVNVDRVTPGQFPFHGVEGEMLSGTGVPKDAGPPPAEGRMVRSMFSRYAPLYTELYEALEAISWMPNGEVPDIDGLEELDGLASFCELLNLLRSGISSRVEIPQLESLVSRGGERLVDAQQDADALVRENSLLIVQLQEQQADLRMYAKANRGLEGRVAELDSNRTKAVKRIKRLKRQADDLGLRSSLLQAQLQAHESYVYAPADKGLRQGISRWWWALRKMRAARRLRSTQLEDIRRSSCFDCEWYLENNLDVRKAALDPVEHYYDRGWIEGRNPSPDFDTYFYLRTYSDVRDSVVNPLWHFVAHGQKEGRATRRTGQ